jgi:hypothetical protein
MTVLLRTFGPKDGPKTPEAYRKVLAEQVGKLLQRTCEAEQGAISMTACR